MSCSCNGYCNNTNCSNHIPPCGNSYPFTYPVTSGNLIRAGQMNQLNAAVNGAYTRRGIGIPSWPSFPVAVSNIITAARYNTTKTNINVLHAGLVTEVFTAGNLIYGTYSGALQVDANTVRNECICNYNCTCNINCSCNVNCVCDYP